MNKKPNILERANEIVNKRSEEKEREYGPMSQGFERAAMIASGMSGKEWNAHDMFIAMAALKLSRQSYNFKEDNLLDLVSYLGAWQNYIDESGDKNIDSRRIQEPQSSEEDSQLSLPFEEYQTKNYDLFEVDKIPQGVTAKPVSPLREYGKNHNSQPLDLTRFTKTGISKLL